MDSSCDCKQTERTGSLYLVLILLWSVVGCSSRTVREQFWEEGVVGPWRLDEHYNQGGALLDILSSFQAQESNYGPKPGQPESSGRRPVAGYEPDWSKHYRRLSRPLWLKTYWVAIPELFALATQPHILRLLNETIGPNVMLWGALALRRGPGVTHGWHTEVEAARVCKDAATVWIGVEGLTALNVMRVVTHSHHIPDEPLLGEGSVNTSCAGIVNDAKRLEACVMGHHAYFAAQGERLAARVRERTGRPAKVVSFNMTDGDFLMFQGQAYHGVPAGIGNRWVFILHYTSPACPVRQPFNFRAPPSSYWPQHMAPARMVLGSATPEQHLHNHILEAAIFPGDLPVTTSDYLAQGFLGDAPKPLSGPLAFTWRGGGPAPEGVRKRDDAPTMPGLTSHYSLVPHRSTALMELLWCSVAKMAYGPQQVHPLEQHPAMDQVMLMLAGNASVTRVGPGAQYPVKWAFEEGTLVYHPGKEPHTVACLSPKGCTMFECKWRPRERAPDMFMPVGYPLEALPGAAWETQRAKGPYTLLERAALGSGLLLHLHVTQLEPGQAMDGRPQPFEGLFVVTHGSLEVGSLARNGTVAAAANIRAGEVLIRPAGSAMTTAAGPEGCRLLVLELAPRLLPPQLAGLARVATPALQLMLKPPGVQPCAPPRHLPAAAPPAGAPGAAPRPSLQYQGSWAFGAGMPAPLSPALEPGKARQASELQPGVTLATHGDMASLPALRQLCRAYAGPISAALLVMTDNGRATSKQGMYGRHQQPHAAASSTWAAPRANSTSGGSGVSGGGDPQGGALPAGGAACGPLPGKEMLQVADGTDVFTLSAVMPELLRHVTLGAPCQLTVQLYAQTLAEETRHLLYPHAALRNAALAAVATQLVALVEVDLVPSAQLAKWHGDAQAYGELMRLLAHPPEPTPPRAATAGAAAAAVAAGGAAEAGRVLLGTGTAWPATDPGNAAASPNNAVPATAAAGVNCTARDADGGGECDYEDGVVGWDTQRRSLAQAVGNAAGEAAAATVLALPVFELDGCCGVGRDCAATVAALAAGDKRSLAEAVNAGRLLPVLTPARPPHQQLPHLHHDVTDYPRWLGAVEPYAPLYEWPYDPPLLMATSAALWHDETFFGHPTVDRSTRHYLLRLHLMGARLAVPHNAWLVRLPHRHRHHQQQQQAAGHGGAAAAGAAGGAAAEHWRARDGSSATSWHAEAVRQATAHAARSIPAVERWLVGGDTASLDVYSRYTGVSSEAGLGPSLSSQADAKRLYPGCQRPAADGAPDGVCRVRALLESAGAGSLSRGAAGADRGVNEGGFVGWLTAHVKDARWERC